ncbi:MAG: ribosome-associated protein [Chloroflexi bacterium]|jgi:ribosome-associated protein|nr:MAG: ribosome-associated protein [Chloroflexota bacterium]
MVDRHASQLEVELNPFEIAKRVVEIAEEKQASDILILDLREISNIADFFVIMTAESQRQMEALAEDIVRSIKKSKKDLYHKEGNTDSGWLLLDYGDVIVHVFAPKERHYYRLEEFWSDSKEVVRIQ